MTKIKPDNSSTIFKMIETGTSPEKILAMFPQEKKEIQEIFSLISSIRLAENQTEAPRKILQEILEKNRILNEAPGRSFIQESFNKIINNLNFMNQKLKYSISVVGIILLLATGVIIFKSIDNGSKITTNQKTKTVSETKFATTTPVIGNKAVDASVNETLNEALNESDLDAELEDVELALNDESTLDEINNLVNDNEL